MLETEAVEIPTHRPPRIIINIKVIHDSFGSDFLVLFVHLSNFTFYNEILGRTCLKSWSTFSFLSVIVVFNHVFDCLMAFVENSGNFSVGSVLIIRLSNLLS